MFRLQEQNLPPDASEPADLKKLGYFINNVGQIRSIDYPDHNFMYKQYSNERHNEVRNEAMQICQREEVLKRLQLLGIERLYIPQLTANKPDGPHVPILAPPADVLRTRKRVILLINGSLQDLGILAYRQLQRDLGLNGGSVVNFTKEIIQRNGEFREDFSIFEDKASVPNLEKETPGLIVTNCGQLCYSHKYNRAMTLRSWNTLPRPSISHESVKMHPVHNHVEGHRNPQEHIKWIFDNVIQREDFVANDAQVHVLAIEDGADSLFQILGKEFDKYAARITAMAVVNSLVSASQISDPKLKTFLHERARQWTVCSTSDNPRDCIEAPAKYASDVDVSNNSQVGDYNTSPICATFADQNPLGVGECVFTCGIVQNRVLDFFDEVSQDPVKFKNPVFKVAASESDNAGYHPLLLPEKLQINDKKEELMRMKEALRDTSATNPDLLAGREGLEKRIAQAEKEVRELTEHALATGALKAGEAQGARDGWKEVGGGPKIPFAGVMIPSETIRGAGLLKTAEEGLAALDLVKEE